MKNLILALLLIIPISFYGGFTLGKSRTDDLVITLLESNKQDSISEARDSLNALFAIKAERIDLIEKMLLIKLTNFLKNPVYISDADFNDDLKILIQKASKYQNKYCEKNCLGQY